MKITQQMMASTTRTVMSIGTPLRGLKIGRLRDYERRPPHRPKAGRVGRLRVPLASCQAKQRAARGRNPTSPLSPRRLLLDSPLHEGGTRYR